LNIARDIKSRLSGFDDLRIRLGKDIVKLEKSFMNTTTAMIPITAAIITHGFSNGSVRLLMMLPNIQMTEEM
jgi:hypothetical protein